MIGAVNFFAKAAAAVKLQTGLAACVCVSLHGTLDAIGAYGYAYDDRLRESVDILRESANSIMGDKYYELAAGAQERALEIVLDEAGVELTKALMAYNDGRVLFPGELSGNESMSLRRERVLKALERGMIPGYPSKPLEEAA